MLVIDGDQRQIVRVREVSGHRLEIGDHHVRLKFLEERLFQLSKCLQAAAEFTKIGGQRFGFGHLVIFIGNHESLNLEHIELVLEIAVAAIVAGQFHLVPLRHQMPRHLLGTGGMPRAFT